MSRRGYAIALAAAVAVLLGSMGLALLVVVGHHLQGEPGRGPGGYGGPGMMWRGDDSTDLAPAASRRIASDWLAVHQPGAQLGSGSSMPMGDVYDVTRDGVLVGRLVVTDSGQVAYREVRSPSPAPSAS